MRDFARLALLPALCGLSLFILVSCAGTAALLGVETTAETERKVKAIHDGLDIAGPYGSLIATGIGALLVGVNHAYRNSTRAKALRKQGTPPSS